MANLISNTDRVTYEAGIQDMHDTFAREIIVWKKSTATITAQDGDYDAFSDGGPQHVTYATESRTIMARIKYIDKQDKEFGLVAANSKIDVTQEFQLIRIKVSATDNEYIKDCEKITVDGKDLIPVTTPRAHGLFGADWFTIYLGSNP